MQAVTINNKIYSNEMYNIIKEAIKNKKSVYYNGLFISEKSLNLSVKNIKLNNNNLTFQYLTLKNDEIIKKIKEITLSSKESTTNKYYKVWYYDEQEKENVFDDLWIFIMNKLEEIEIDEIYFQILIENDLYIMNSDIFQELYRIMNEKSINYRFNSITTQIESYNSSLNLNNNDTLNTSFYVPFQILVEEKDKKLEYLLVGCIYIKCLKNKVFEVGNSHIIHINSNIINIKTK